MKKHTTAERLKTIMQERNLKQADILRLAEPYCVKYGIPLRKNDLSQYVNGKYEPGQFKMTILAKALDVSEAWLMGLDVPMSQALDEAIEKANQLKEILSEIHRLIDSLSSFKNSLSAEEAKAATREAITECLNSLLTKDEGN